jgi:preprotein translocase subunit SecA
MFKNITKVLGGDPVRRVLAQFSAVVEAVDALEAEMKALSDEALRAKTGEFRSRLAGGESLDSLLPEAFAAVREASVRTVGLRHFDVQLVGGAVLHQGKIAEMRTGEGKTLVATLPLYLNALEGKGVHLVTVNDYLARRDARWMGPIFHFLGLTVGVLQEASRTENGRKAFLYDPERVSSQEDVHQLRLVDRRLAYAADVTYGTNNEFGFDYLRDNMAHSLEARSQRGHHYAIVDEVDNILIDEARTPLIISGPAEEDPELYVQMARAVKGLRPEDFEVNERDRTVALTEAGEEHVEQIIGRTLRDPDRPEDVTLEQARLIGHLEQALRAEHLFRRNKDYVVQSGRVIIVDEFTGRLMAGRRWSDGLHQAVEAKEGVRVREENVTYATITLQNYFRMYAKLAGMTGTAMTEAEEFNKIYKVDVVALPTNLEYLALRPGSDLVEVESREDGLKFSVFTRPDDPEKRPVFWRRKDYPDVVYRTEDAKLRAVTAEILRRHVLGQPMLVGTTSVELSERLSARLRGEPLQHLALVMILRDAYLEANNLPDDGMRVEALLPLYEPIETLAAGVLRQFARDLNLPANPSRPENLERLARLLELEAADQPRLVEALQGGIPHNVLNAKEHDRESLIIASAGGLGSVTIATNMAGRGVDIKLGGEIPEETLGLVNRVLRRAGVEDPYNMNMDQRLAALEKADPEAIGIYEDGVRQFREFMEGGKRVKELGGLHVIGSQRHEARRIDNQLRGRSARQGDPGSSQFFLSLEDELMRLFGGAQVSSLMQRLNIDDLTPIGHSIVDKTIEQSQTRVEGANFDTRKHLLEYDDVLNKQREVFYGQRNRVFTKDDLSEDVGEMLSTEVERRVRLALEDPEGPWRLLAWLEETQPTLGLDSPEPYPSYMLRLLIQEIQGRRASEGLKTPLLDIARGSLEAQHERLFRFLDDQVERAAARLEDQVRQRAEAADSAVEAAALEAEESGGPLDGRVVERAVQEATGLRLSLAGGSVEPDDLRRTIPGEIESVLQRSMWAELVQVVERRVGEPLGVEQAPPSPFDWGAVGERLHQALDQLWSRRLQALLGQIQADLDAWLTDEAAADEATIARLLVRMSYGSQAFFDRKTHQRRSVVVARLSYTYGAARLLENTDPETLTTQVLEHLRGAQVGLQRAIGRAETSRIGANKLEELDERLRQRLLREWGEEAYAEALTAASLVSLSPAAKAGLAQVLGQWVLTGFYRRLILSVGDRLWVEYLTEMEALRTSIGLEAYGQRDPLVQYKSRAFDMFQVLLTNIRSGVVSGLFRIAQPASSRPQPAPAPAPLPERAPAAEAAEVIEAGHREPDVSEDKKKRRRRRR